MIRLEKLSDTQYDVFFVRVFMGKFQCEVDGMFVFFPHIKEGGSWTAYIMEEIVFELNYLNERGANK